MSFQSIVSGTYPPLLLQEGLAVYLTGGHYHSPEPLPRRAAALIPLGRYIPLADLADSFYLSQHEDAYLEAAAFTEYLVQTYGWDRYWKMFRNAAGAQSPSRALDDMLQSAFGASLAQCEAAWRQSLLSIPPDDEIARDVDFTARLFDAVRRYEKLYDPSANYLDFWIPNLEDARKRQITADYLRHPSAVDNITLELLMEAAFLQAGDRDWKAAEDALQAITSALDARAQRDPDPLAASALALEYRQLAETVQRAGYEPLEVSLAGEQANVTARPINTLRKEVQLWERSDGNWARVR